MKKIKLILIAAVLLFGGILFWSQLDTSLQSNERISTPPSTPQQEILFTDGVKHSIPLDEITSDHPNKSETEEIISPKFESVADADGYLYDKGLGIGIVDGGVERFYPFQVLAWHEIVNDNIGNVPVLVTYCPICGTAVVYNRTINEQAEVFSVSGKIYNSNLLMQDQSTNSYWSQALGKAVVGEHTGSELSLYPWFENITWGEWKKTHPNSEVLSRDSDCGCDYTQEP